MTKQEMMKKFENVLKAYFKAHKAAKDEKDIRAEIISMDLEPGVYGKYSLSYQNRTTKSVTIGDLLEETGLTQEELIELKVIKMEPTLDKEVLKVQTALGKIDKEAVERATTAKESIALVVKEVK
jgi:hypothetical protein